MGQWSDDPTVAGWLAENPAAADTAYSEVTPHPDATTDTATGAALDDTVTGQRPTPGDVRGGVGSGDPTQQFPAVDVPVNLDAPRTGGYQAAGQGYPSAAPSAGLTSPAAVPVHHRNRIVVWAGRYRWPLAIVGAAVVVLVATIAVLGTTASGPAPKAAGSGIVIPSGAASAPAAADADCPTGTQGPTTTGRDGGGTDSGPAVIKAFEHAYYVDRSGDKARAVVSPTAKNASGAPFSSGPQLQASIDKFIAPQTLHCVSITDRGAGLYAVTLTETPPHGVNGQVYHQLIQTTTDQGRTWIVSIATDPAFP